MPKKSKTEIREQLRGVVQHREAHIQQRDIDKDSRSVDLSFSSENGVERWYGMEILDHSFGSVRLARINDGAPLLLQHRSGAQIGVIDTAEIAGDRKGRAVVRFSNSALGEEIFADVRDGIRQKVSVGYIVHDMRLDSKSDDDGEVYRITDWEPIEVSIVSLPADSSIGIGRSLDPLEAIMPEKTHEQVAEPVAETIIEARADQSEMDDAGTERQPTAAEPVLANPEADQIRVVGSHFQMREQAEDHIALGGTLEGFRDFVRTQRPDPVAVVPIIQARIPHHGSLRAFRAEHYGGDYRQSEEAAYRSGMFCRVALFGDQDAARWCRDHQVQLAIGNDRMQAVRVFTGNVAGQSVLVPDELVLPIINLREEYGVMRRLADVHPMASDTATVPRRTSGVTAYFVGRETAPTANDPGLDNISLTARNLAAETRISNDYADDSVINLADFVANEHALAFATKEDSCAIDGDGTSTYGGIVGLRTLLLDSTLAGSVDAASGNDTFLEITSADLDGVVSALPDFPGLMPVWLVSKRGESLMFGRLRTAAGGNTKRDLAERVAKQWDGDPIEISQAMPKGTGTTDYSNVVMGLYGDFRQGVTLGDRRGMTMLADPYSLSSYQQVKIISSERFDVNCHGIGDASNAGPIVALVGE